MAARRKLNFRGSCLMYMPKTVSEFFRDAAASLRDLALRAPDIANDLRRFADDLEEEARRAARDDRPWDKDDAAD
jgi:hypothetical protein